MAVAILLIIFLIVYVYFRHISLGADDTIYYISIYDTDNTVISTPEEINPLEATIADRNGELLQSLPILMYHVFYDSAAGQRGKDANWMEISDFEKQMRYLAESGFYFPTWEEVSAFVNGEIELPVRSVVVTVDDGDSSFFELALPILNMYNIRATSFIVTSWMPEDIKDMYPSELIHFESHSHDMHRAGRDRTRSYCNS